MVMIAMIMTMIVIMIVIVISLGLWLMPVHGQLEDVVGCCFLMKEVCLLAFFLVRSSILFVPFVAFFHSGENGFDVYEHPDLHFP